MNITTEQSVAFNALDSIRESIESERSTVKLPAIMKWEKNCFTNDIEKNTKLTNMIKNILKSMEITNIAITLEDHTIIIYLGRN